MWFDWGSEANVLSLTMGPPIIARFSQLRVRKVSLTWNQLSRESLKKLQPDFRNPPCNEIFQANINR